MVAQTREGLLATSFISLTDTLVIGYDVVDLLQTLVDTCAAILHATAVGLLLADKDGVLEVVACTNERSRLLEILQLRSGPCVECFTTGTIVSLPDVLNASPEWTEFSSKAQVQGFSSVHAVPLRLKDLTIGTLNLFRESGGYLNAEDAAAAQALADVATIGIFHAHALQESQQAREQLQHALDSRIIIEQAKGVIAQLCNVEMDEAFNKIRSHARSHRIPLREVAARVVDRTLTL